MHDGLKGVKPTPLAAATEMFQQRFADAEVLLLAGSVIRGQGTAFSDLDVVVVYSRVDHAWRESFTHAGWPVEAFVHDPETLRYFYSDVDGGVPSLAAMVSEGLEVPGPTAFSAALKTEACAVLAAGPPCWNEHDLRKARYGISDLCDDLRGSSVLAELRAIGGRLYPELANFWMRAHGHWGASGKTIPRRLAVLDASLSARFEQAFGGLLAAGDPTGVLSLAEELLAPFGGHYFDGYRMDAPTHFRRERDSTNTCS